MSSQKRFQVRTGSALLATILLVSAIGLIGAGVARFSLVQLKIATSLEDSSLAYSAAEAGLEEGLLRVRFARNIEVPVANMQQTNRVGEQVNLATGALQTSGTVQPVPLGVGPYAADEQFYELRIWYKEPQIGSAAASDLASPDYPYRLYKDQTLELDVSSLRGQNLTFAYQAASGVVARIETRVAQENCGGTGLFCEASKQLTDLSINQTGITISIPSGSDGAAYRLRIKPYLFVTGTSQPAPSNSYIAYHLQPQTTSSVLDAGITNIESTGYYGSAKRTLVAKVDRRTGTVLGIFDYALFANETVTRP